MAEKTIKMRAVLKDGITEIKALISHPMETGRREERGALVPAHFIQWLTIAHNGKTVLEAQWGTGVSRNPYLTCYLRDARVGDHLVLTWHDNLGESGRHEVTVTAAL